MSRRAFERPAVARRSGIVAVLCSLAALAAAVSAGAAKARATTVVVRSGHGPKSD